MLRALTLLFFCLACTCVRAQRQTVQDLRMALDTTESVDLKIDLYSLIYDRVRRDTAVANGVIDTMRMLRETTESEYSIGLYYRYLSRHLNQKGQFEAGKVAIQRGIDALLKAKNNKQLAMAYIDYAALFR
ncbi:MAG: hypothetical protein AAF597_15930, partial [Bacteroidota bacterium]